MSAKVAFATLRLQSPWNVIGIIVRTYDVVFPHALLPVNRIA